MPTPLVVPDASILLKWVLPSDHEPDADRALLLRAAIVDETVRALLPALWLYEVGNTLGRKFPEQAAGWLSALIKFGIKEAAPSTPWLAKVLELVRRHEVTFYDAAYHSLALIYGGVFVTADTRYVSRAAQSGSVVALAEWQLPRKPPRRSKGKSA
jgi:predicted nucleic acid-binding protein